MSRGRPRLNRTTCVKCGEPDERGLVSRCYCHKCAAQAEHVYRRLAAAAQPSAPTVKCQYCGNPSVTPVCPLCRRSMRVPHGEYFPDRVC